MSNYTTFLLVLLSIFCLSCQDAPSKMPEVNNATEATNPVIPSPQNSAISELKQEQPLTAYAKQFYTNNLWRYDAAIVIKDPEKSKTYIGKWIKFHPDNTLETSFYDGTITKGNWAIDEATNIITIVESGERPTYSEWKIKTSSSSDDIMIWVGTSRFGLNNTQIKMLRYKSKPSKVEQQN